MITDEVIMETSEGLSYFPADRSLEQSINATPSAAPTASETISESNDALIIRETLRVYGSLYLIFFLAFCYLRRKFPKYYNIRSWVPEMECELAHAEYPGWFSWAWRVMYVNDTQLLQNIGMDGLCFIRSLRLGAKLSFSGVINSVWLIPLFLTADEDDAQVTVVDKFAKISVANVPAGSPRMAGVVVAAYFTLFYALHLLSKELDWYAEFRHKYLSQRLPQNFSIYVSGIPEELRSDFALGDYFRSWSSQSAIVESHMTMDTPSLDADVAKRDVLVEKLEHAIAKEKIHGVKAKHRIVSLRNVFRQGALTEKVDSVPAYRKELDKLNHKISLAIGNISNRNHRMRQFMSKQPGSGSGKILSVPTLSPIGEQEQEIFFHPEESLGDESIDYLFGDHLKTEDDEEVPLAELGPTGGSERVVGKNPERTGYLHRKDTPPHPFLQLVGMPEFCDDGTNTQPNSESNQPMSTTSIETHVVAQLLDIEAGDNHVEQHIGGKLEETSEQWQNADFGHDSSTSGIVVPSGSSSRHGNLSETSFGHAATGIRNLSSKVKHSATIGVVGGVKKVSGSVNQVKRATGKGVQTAVKAADLGISSAKKAAEMGVHQLQRAPELASKLKETAAFIAPVLAGKEDGAPRNAGFVVFRNLFTCQAARQMLQHAAASQMVVEPAPPPHEIFWRNVGLPDNARKTGTLLSAVATTTLCFFWSIPMAFLSSLTEVDSLKEKLPTLARWVEEFPWLESFLATIAPLLLLLINEGVLPNVLKWFSTWEGLVGAPQLEASTFVKLSCFVIVQTFFVSAVSGSITAELANIIDNPEDIVVLLGNSLATQSSYFIQIVLVFTFMAQGIALLRVQPIGGAILRRYVGPRLTAKERRKSWKFARSLEDPPAFFHAEVFAQLVLFYVIFFVYAPIAPVTCIFLWGAFLLCECGYRYHFIHNYKTSPDSGGRIFKGFTRVLLGSIFIGELTLIGTLGLKQAVYAIPALAPLLIITILYTVLVYPKKMHVANSLPTILSVELDRQREAEGEGIQFLIGKYLQPSLQQKVVFPDEDIDPGSGSST